VIRDSSGNSIEYLGTAKNGLPHGTGGLIARYTRETGSFYFEGSFEKGLPDGMLRVEEPGQRPRFREFRAGKDVGSGVAGQVETLVF
jgi:hypothetical protein